MFRGHGKTSVPWHGSYLFLLSWEADLMAVSASSLLLA